MGGSSGSGKSTTTNYIPDELKGLTTKTADRVGNLQDQPGFNPGDYMTNHPVNVPGLSGNQAGAVRQAGQIGNQTSGETAAYGSLGSAGGYANQSSMPWASQSGQATGATFANDPSIAAAYNAYKSQAEPGIQNQYGLMGLGKSTSAGDAMARGAAGYLYPATQEALAREQAANEARIAREQGASENQIGRQTSTALNTAGQYAGLGSQDTQRRLAGLNALLTTGGLERQVGSEQANAEQNDFLRRQGLAESNTTGILGGLPSSWGSTVKTSGSSK